MEDSGSKNPFHRVHNRRIAIGLSIIFEAPSDSGIKKGIIAISPAFGSHGLIEPRLNAFFRLSASLLIQDIY